MNISTDQIIVALSAALTIGLLAIGLGTTLYKFDKTVKTN